MSDPKKKTDQKKTPSVSLHQSEMGGKQLAGSKKKKDGKRPSIRKDRRKTGRDPGKKRR